MSSLINPIETFKIPTWEDLSDNTNQDLVIGYTFRTYTKRMYQGSTAVKPINEITETNKKVIGQLKALTTLDDNWDEEGALSITEQAIRRAIHWVKIINAFDLDVYFASPGPNGEILLLLKGDNKKELELIIYPDKEKYIQFDSKNFVEQGAIMPENFIANIDWFKGVK